MTYQKRPVKPIERYARRVKMKEIEANDFNLNISRYVSTAEFERAWPPALAVVRFTAQDAKSAEKKIPIISALSAVSADGGSFSCRVN